MRPELILEASMAAIVGALVTGSTIILRRWISKEMKITRAAALRLLKSNRVQGEALIAIAVCQKGGQCNGGLDDAVTAVKNDQRTIANWVREAAMGVVPEEEEDIP